MFGGKQLVPLMATGSDGLALTSAADIFVIPVPFKCKPVRSGINISTAISSSVSVVLKFDRKVSSSSRGDGDIGTLTIPNGTAIGDCIYQDSDYNADGSGTWDEYLEEGDLIYVQVTTASDSAGKGLPWVLVEPCPERPANNAGMSATSN